MSDYPITFHWSFFLVWGFGLLMETYLFGNILGIAYTGICLLILFTHEYAHAEKCIKTGCVIKGIEFAWLGGHVKAEFTSFSDVVECLSAGAKDSAYYSISFVGLFAFLSVFGRDLVGGYLFLLFPFRDLVLAITLFATLFAISHYLPISIWSKTHKVMIRPDGWAAWKMREMRDELWNDGKVIADSLEVL